MDNHHIKKEELESVGESSEGCSQIVFKCLYLARIGGPDILWSVNKLARSVTKWTHAYDRRLARLISYIHHTRDYRQDGHFGNAAQHCRFGFFQDSDFAGDFEDSKSTSGEHFVHVWKPHIGSDPLDVQEHQYLSVPQYRKLLHWMLDCEWMYFYSGFMERGW